MKNKRTQQAIEKAIQMVKVDLSTLLSIPDQENAMEAQSIDNLTYNYWKDGVQLRREISKEILSNTGLWADVAFLHQDKNYDGGWKSAKTTIVRFKKICGIWKKQNHLNINYANQADRIVRVLSLWKEKLK